MAITQTPRLQKMSVELDATARPTSPWTTRPTSRARTWRPTLVKKPPLERRASCRASEEDIRLQSVNMFSEGMANQANVGKNKESQQEGGLCGNGIKASSEPPARDETIVVQENNLDKMNTMQKAQPVSKTVLDPTACSSQLKNDSSAHTESFIGVCAETRTNETTLHKPDDSLDLYQSHWGTASTKEVLGLPSSLLTAMTRRRRKKRWLSMASTQSGHERRADEEQSQAPFCHDIKLLPGGGPCQYESRYRSRDEDDFMCLQCFNPPSCEDQFNREDSRPEVQAATERPHWDDDDDNVDGGHGDTLSAAKSVPAAQTLHSGGDKYTGCQRQAEPQQQLEMEPDNLDQNSYELNELISRAQKSTFPNTLLQRCETAVSPVDEIVTKVTCDKLTCNFINSSAHKSRLSERPSGLALEETEPHVESNTFNDEDKETSCFGGPFSDNNQRETNSVFDDTRSVPASSNENIAGSCSSPSPLDPVNRCHSTTATYEEGDHDTGQLTTGDDGVISTSCEPDKPVESKPVKTGEDTCEAVQSDPDSTSSKCVLLWESETVDMYPEKETVTSFSGPPRHGNPPKGLRQLSKNVSVHNLRALNSLEPESEAKKGQMLQTLEELELKKQDGHPQSLDSTYCFSFSLSDMFQYLLGRKQQIPSQSATDDISNFNTDGNSVPETYDRFFAEFDIENLFDPFVTEEKRTKILPVAFGQTNLHLAEAYDYFCATSSSDDSAGEEEEESCGPMTVVSRLNQKSGATRPFTDNYENFFCDGDMRENFFWTATFSFRNVHLRRGAVRNKRSRFQNVKNAPPFHDLGHMNLPELLVEQRENGISRRILAEPLRCEDMQRAVPNPRTDISLLPLRQSDMCLVCIAFASWVLKTANPQVGDMWKAVLLANVSALSAIRYLRKHAKVEVADGQKKEHLTTLGGT
ncbi:PGC-1 and ERR-induced regulator in muscle protein 1 isoform X2 [Phyllopteryx taeniolatus]|uniref:PGC-1 and ERR-induced regulator in muscle protein 1 isoform X2 n=1 Tax=Phyllopteryx taeniolatus TaxID=161469 RepID=UPI002AD3C79C|nr:PGC-1 and ERR-induced regulator in muscle protein 1 isoform X2 [Phyllopteryx taeniolatus]